MANTVVQKDDLVTSAMAHWSAQFVSNRVAVTEVEENTGSLRSCRAWSVRAADHEDMGHRAEGAQFRKRGRAPQSLICARVESAWVFRIKARNSTAF